MQEYDVAIIGAGPAGSMLARFLGNKSLKTALIDARNLDKPYEGKGLIKSCGGMLAPDAQKFLKSLKIEIPAYIQDDIQPKYVKTYDVQSKQTRRYGRNYINLDREAFDRFLLEGIKADNFFGFMANDIKKENGHFIINDKIKAKILVGADGCQSKVRRVFFPDLGVRKYISIQDVLENQLSREYECYFDEKISDYYGWSLPKGDKTLVGFAIKEKDNALEKFEKFKKAKGFGKEIERQGTLILRPGFFHKISCYENLFLIGEAGGYISPSSAEGISYAFKTAKILFDSNFDVKTFKRKMFKIQLNIFYKNLKSLIMYVPFFRKMVMRLSIFN
ncbi:MAG: FAD-dependent monooxygenase [Lactobacillaceae bacterium]|nr:FAD-dependent monooxygenase [Lactobacillaceae bacterium]